VTRSLAGCLMFAALLSLRLGWEISNLKSPRTCVPHPFAALRRMGGITQSPSRLSSQMTETQQRESKALRLRFVTSFERVLNSPTVLAENYPPIPYTDSGPELRGRKSHPSSHQGIAPIPVQNRQQLVLTDDLANHALCSQRAGANDQSPSPLESSR
jgi:hypothetical protein